MNSASPHAGRRQGGFTLIELLVSLTILSVILGLLAGGLRVLSRNWDANAERIDTLDMVSRAFDILHRDAAGLQRLAVLRARAPRFLFTGTPDNLSFVTVEPPYPTAEGLYFVDYSVVAAGGNAELIRARAPYQPKMETFPGATPANRVPLFQGPFKYRFAYGRKTGGEGGTWHGTWPYPARLPDLIRLEVVDARSGEPISPPFVAGLRADAELGCIAAKPALCSATTDGELRLGQDLDSRRYRK